MRYPLRERPCKRCRKMFPREEYRRRSDGQCKHEICTKCRSDTHGFVPAVERSCKRCLRVYPREEFRTSAGVYTRQICRSCVAAPHIPRHDNLSEHQRARVIDLYVNRWMTLRAIAKALKVRASAARQALIDAKIKLRPPGTRAPWMPPLHCGDQGGSAAIGKTGSDKWAAIDAQILRARLEAGMIDGRRRSSIDSPWKQSSLVGGS